MTTDAPTTPKEQTGALVGRLFEAGLAASELLCIHLGDHLGFYHALADKGPLTSKDLASATATHERYVREWLEQQAVAGFLSVDDQAADPAARRYTLPPPHAEVFLNPDSPAFMLPFAAFPSTLGVVLPSLLHAFRNGGGVPYADYPNIHELQAAMTRPLYRNFLATDWFPTLPDLHQRLQSDPPARVADVACGGGWAAIAIAQAYPKVQVDGFDLDAPSIALAFHNVRDAGLTDRVRFALRDAADSDLAGQYDLVTVFEAVHDLARPVDVLRSLRRLVCPNGVVLIADERVEEAFTAPGSPLERFYYACSILCCLPAGMADQPSAATGTVMRPNTLRQYAQAAGFRDLEILPIQNDFWRFYRLLT